MVLMKWYLRYLTMLTTVAMSFYHHQKYSTLHKQPILHLDANCTCSIVHFSLHRVFIKIFIWPGLFCVTTTLIIEGKVFYLLHCTNWNLRTVKLNLLVWECLLTGNACGSATAMRPLRRWMVVSHQTYLNQH